MPSLIRRFLADRSGATAIEYALIATGISMAIIVAVQGLGVGLKGKYAELSDALK